MKRSGAKRFVNAILNAELVVFAVLIALCLGTRPFGIVPYAVLSGSMEPTMPVGSLAYVQTSVEPESIREGSIVAFQQGGQTVTHRVFSVDPNAQTFTTKGDANTNPDPAPISHDALIGESVGCIPHLGYLFVFTRDNIGIVLAAVIGCNVMLVLLGQMTFWNNLSERMHHE